MIGMVKPKVIPGDVDTLAQYSPEGCLEREARITAALETLAHPLIVFDRDAAVNVGFSQADCQAGGPVMRLRQPSDGQAGAEKHVSGVWWRRPTHGISDNAQPHAEPGPVTPSLSTMFLTSTLTPNHCRLWMGGLPSDSSQQKGHLAARTLAPPVPGQRLLQGVPA